MIEPILWIAIPVAVGSAFGYTAGGLVRNRLDVHISRKNDNPLLARINISLLFALLLSLGFVFALWALISSIGGSLTQITSSRAPESYFVTLIQFTGYAMGFLGIPGACGFYCAQWKGDWDKKRDEQDSLRTFAAPQL